jgi:hypothetical protein
VAHNHRPAIAKLPDHFGDVSREIVKADLFERSATAADPTGLRPQHPQPAAGEAFGNRRHR